MELLEPLVVPPHTTLVIRGGGGGRSRSARHTLSARVLRTRAVTVQRGGRLVLSGLRLAHARHGLVRSLAWVSGAAAL